MKINLSDAILFDNLLEFKYDDEIYDLHNDYNLLRLEFECGSNIRLTFTNIKTQQYLYLNFEDVEIQELIIEPDIQTLDNFHRGRAEYENELYDILNNKKCFYLEFIGNSKAVILSSKTTIEK